MQGCSDGRPHEGGPPEPAAAAVLRRQHPDVHPLRRAHTPQGLIPMMITLIIVIILILIMIEEVSHDLFGARIDAGARPLGNELNINLINSDLYHIPPSQRYTANPESALTR